jgi:lysophospholipase L1-like esterase
MTLKRLFPYTALLPALLLWGGCSDNDDNAADAVPEGSRAVSLVVQYEAATRLDCETVPYDYWSTTDYMSLGYMTDARDAGTARRISLDGTTAYFEVSASYAASQLCAYFTSNPVLAYNSTVTFDVPTMQRKRTRDDYQDVRRYMEFYTAPVAIEPKSESASALAKPTSAMLRLLIYDSAAKTSREAISSVGFASHGSGALAGNLSCDVSTGELSLMANTGDSISVVWDPVDSSDRLLVPTSEADAQMVGMVVLPVAGVTGAFTVVTDNYCYTFTLSDAMTFEAGYEHTIRLDLAKADKRKVCRVGILGDSISTFKGYISSSYGAYYPAGDVSSVTDTYWYKLIYDLMPAGELDVNSSFAGTRVSDDPKYPGYDFIARCQDFDSPDVIIIHGGTNDSNNSVSLGAYDYDAELDKLDNKLFRPAYIKLIRTIRMRYPGVRIICLVGDRLGQNYAESVAAIAAHYDIPCVNFYGDGANIPKYSGSHPTAAGFTYMANRIYNEAGDCLR